MSRLVQFPSPIQEIQPPLFKLGPSMIMMFLAPTGAKGVTISVRQSVCPVIGRLDQSIFIYLGQRAIRELTEH